MSLQQFLFLLCSRQYVGQMEISGVGPLPTPSLSAWPSSVVPSGSNVTLRCASPVFCASVVLRNTFSTQNLSRTLDPTHSTAEFHLTDLQQSHAGPYTCECCMEDDLVSQPSDELLLLVTGGLPKPSLQAHHAGNVSAGGNVSLQCQRPENMTRYQHFTLLKAGAPFRARASGQDSVAFSLQNATARDSGNYSCVYHQAQAPFWASHPSDPLEISVTGPLPTPSLSAWPSSVVPSGSNVTLRCTSPTPGVHFILRKEGTLLDSRPPNHLIESTAEFHLTDLQQGDAGHYTCECHGKGFRDSMSLPSDVLLLLVTGDLPKPSLQAPQGDVVSAGGSVILRCRKPENMTEYKEFALLKAGTASPARLQSSEEDSVAFSLQHMAVRDSGSYSCVYHQAEAPFRASHPSDPMEISVTGLRFKPRLSVWPSSVLPAKRRAKLRCWSPAPGVDFTFRKGGVPVDSALVQRPTESTAELHLSDLQQSHAGLYTCECYRAGVPDSVSQPSDVLLLLVADGSPKPSLQALGPSKVRRAENVALRCRKPENTTGFKRFALLKAGTASPARLLRSEGDSVDFSLQNVTVSDTGLYSCVYYQAEAPFRTSLPSDPLELLVAGPLPTPSLSAWPSSVAPSGSNVTLRCTSPSPGVHFVLRKEAVPLDSRPPNHLMESTAEFHLTDLQQGDAGHYTCECHRKGFRDSVSPPSDVLLLLVTGDLPKPSLQAPQGAVVSAGGSVILRCRKPENMTEYKEFALLKAGTASPSRLQSSEDSVDFSLHNVTVRDTGSYSCVYHQAEAPFSASSPSDPLQVLVTGSWRALLACYTKGNRIRLGMSTLFVVLLGVFLAEAWYSQRASRSSPRTQRTTL